MFTTGFTCGNMDIKPWLHRNTTALIPIEGIGTAEGCGLVSRTREGCDHGFQKNFIEQSLDDD